MERQVAGAFPGDVGVDCEKVDVLLQVLEHPHYEMFVRGLDPVVLGELGGSGRFGMEGFGMVDVGGPESGEGGAERLNVAGH